MVISAKGLKKVYYRGREAVIALRGVDLQVPRKAFSVVLGPSGCGKSTLLHILGGMDQPTEGELEVDGCRLAGATPGELTRFRRDHIGFIFQFYNLLPSLDALDNVMLPLIARGADTKAARQRAEAMISMVGLEHRRKHKPGQLSGGEEQRIAIARALVAEPALILADEPTGDLDSGTAEEIVSLMRGLNTRLGVTFLVATHNEKIANFATHRFFMRDGVFVEETR